jgi:hypothetical protein
VNWLGNAASERFDRRASRQIGFDDRSRQALRTLRIANGQDELPASGSELTRNGTSDRSTSARNDGSP